MINFYEFERILEENKMLDKVRVGLKRAGEKVDRLLGDNPHQRQADNRQKNKDSKEFGKILDDIAKENSHPYGDWEDHFDNDREAGITTKEPKNAPQGKRNAECARCGNKDKAKLYDINAGKAKCKNCGGYLHLIS